MAIRLISKDTFQDSMAAPFIYIFKMKLIQFCIPPMMRLHVEEPFLLISVNKPWKLLEVTRMYTDSEKEVGEGEI